MTLQTMVGRESFTRAYFFYVFLLEFLYLLLCLSRPLFAVLADGNTGLKFEDSTWPLGAALLVVGVLPATPIVAQIESALRRFSHSMAQIPDEFFGRVAALSHEDLERLVKNVHQYKPELELYWKINNLLVVLAVPSDDARRMARKCVAVRLFHEWTIDGKDIWSPQEYERYKDVFDLLKPRSEGLKLELDSLIRLTEQNSYVSKSIAKYFPVNETYRLKTESIDSNILRLVPDVVDGRTSVNNSDEESIEQLRASWAKISTDCDVAGRRLIALFSIIVRNDKRVPRQLERPPERGKSSATRY
jgi:hypothetical protein